MISKLLDLVRRYESEQSINFIRQYQLPNVNGSVNCLMGSFNLKRLPSCGINSDKLQRNRVIIVTLCIIFILWLN